MLLIVINLTHILTPNLHQFCRIIKQCQDPAVCQVSIALARRALANGDVSAALAGGVNAITSPDVSLLSLTFFVTTAER